MTEPTAETASSIVPLARQKTIERIGHIVWVGPHDPPQECIDSWPKVNPGITWTIWRDHTKALGWINQEQIDARAARQEWNGVADLCRLEILARCGGIAVDADSTAIKPLEEGDFFAQEMAVACFENEQIRPGLVGCGFLGAPQGYPFFKACVEEASKQDHKEPAAKTVGPGLMTRMAQAHPDMIKVYPARSFNPKHFSGEAAPGKCPIYGNQLWGSTLGYNSMRKWPCQCQVCRNNTSMLFCPWA